MTRRAIAILWPAFLMAGVLEMLVFVVVDPGELRWFGGPPLDWSASADYTVTYLIYRSVIATAGAMSAEARTRRLSKTSAPRLISPRSATATT